MKETETAKPIENTAYKNALSIAKTIIEVMGEDFFTIEQMRKKMMVPKKNKKNMSPLSWGEARGYVHALIPYGLIEVLGAVKDCYKIRLDKEFQIKYLRNQIAIRNTEIDEFMNLITGLEFVISPAAESPKTPKKTTKTAKKKE